MRSLQLEDIITTEKPKLATISPNGNKVAFVLEQAHIEKNKITDTLYVWDKNSGSTTAPLQLENIKKILWIDDVFYVLGQKEKEEHNFVKPKARLASMKRKVDWFNYWFFDRRDPLNPGQYIRWDEMRTTFNKA